MDAKDEKAPAGNRGGDSFSTSPLGYAELTEHVKKMFPAWASAPELLHASIVELRDLILPKLAKPDIMESFRLTSKCSGQIILHISGGRVWFDPENQLSPRVVDLVRALKLVLGDQLTVGRPVWVPRGCTVSTPLKVQS
jgi:hypothetical protein